MKTCVVSFEDSGLYESCCKYGVMKTNDSGDYLADIAYQETLTEALVCAGFKPIWLGGRPDWAFTGWQFGTQTK